MTATAQQELNNESAVAERDPAPGIITGGLKSEDLRNLINRVERLEEKKSEVMEDIKTVYQEAKSAGFDPKTMKEIVKKRKMDAHDLEEQELLLELYKRAIGMS
jgi:uncharacterized protein (UPF0335 family)